MKRLSLLLALALFVPSLSMSAGTKLSLRSTTQNTTPSGDDVVARKLSVGRGTSPTTFTKDSIAGPAGSLGAADQFTISAASDEKFSFLSDHLKAGRVDQQIKVHLWAYQSSSAIHASLAATLDRTGPTGTVISRICEAKRSLDNILYIVPRVFEFKLNVKPTTLVEGDRVLLKIYADDAVGATQASGGTIGLVVDGAVNSVGDSYVEYFDRVVDSFAASLTPTRTSTRTPTPTPTATPTATP